MSEAQKAKVTRAKKLVRTYTRLLRKSDFPVSGAFLYGSYAKGNARKGSDIDVCIISKAYDPEDDRKRLLLWEKRRGVDMRIEPIAYHPEDFDDSNPLVHEIKDHGIRVI